MMMLRLGVADEAIKVFGLKLGKRLERKVRVRIRDDVQFAIPSETIKITNLPIRLSMGMKK